MGSSLKDQLLKAGLVTPEQVARAERPPRTSAKRRDRTGRRAPPRPEPARARAPSAHAPAAAPVDRKALRKRVKAFLSKQRLNDKNADQPFHIVRGGRIKRVYVSAAQRVLLRAGELVIAAVYGNHYLITAADAARLQAMLPGAVIHSARAAAGEEDGAAEREGEDPYAGYEVPDDLVW